MKSAQRRDLQKLLNLGLFAISLIPVILYFFLLVQRVPLPVDLEWGEGAGINQISRYLSGEVVYGEPALEFAPLVYTPFYYWITSLLARVLNDILLSGRLISALSSLGSAVLIIWLVARETRDQLGAWLSGALYLACFAVSDGFYDLIRVDSLYILILLATLAILRYGTKPAAVIMAGLIIALGFYTKQSALIVIVPLGLYLIAGDWRRYWLIAPAVILGLIVPFWIINKYSGGWFYYYLFELPGLHGYSIVSAVKFWVSDLLSPLGISLAFGLVGVLYRKNGARRQTAAADHKSGSGSDFTAEKDGTLIYVFFAVGAIGAAWITRASNGGGANNVMSAYAALAILFGLGYSKAAELIQGRQMHQQQAQLILASLAAIQFLGLVYNPFDFLPTSDEIRDNRTLVEEMAEVDGGILIPYRSHLPQVAGKETSIHAVNLFELTGYFKGDILPAGRDLVNQIQENICYQAYGMIVLDQPVPWFDAQLDLAYEADEDFGGLTTGARSPVLTWQGGLNDVFVPREDYDLNACLNSVSIKDQQ